MRYLSDYELLNQYSGVPLGIDTLLAAFGSYAYPHDKVSQLVQQGLLVRLRRGLYVVAPQSQLNLPATSSLIIANSLYGPSYVSLETALSLHGLIPEHVYSVRSMTFNRGRDISTSLGRFEYVRCPRAYYALGITMREEERGSALIARPEKAIADAVVSAKDIRLQSTGAVRTFLEEDMRIDMDELAGLNGELFNQIASRGYKKRVLELLAEVVEHA